MASTLVIIGIIIFFLSRMLKKNIDESPGSKNWNHSINSDVEWIKQELSEMEYLHGKLAVCEERLYQLETAGKLAGRKE